MGAWSGCNSRGGGRLQLPSVRIVPLLLASSLARIKLPFREKRVFMDNSTLPRPRRSGFEFPRYDARIHDGDEVQLASIHGTWLSLSFNPAFTLRGRTVALQASNGRFCAVDRGHPQGKIKCNQRVPPFAAWFEVSQGTHNISLRGVRGGKFCSDEPEGILCNRGAVSRWEAFDIVDAGDGNIALRGGRRGNFCADEGHGMVCEFKSMSDPAVFRPVTDAPLRGRIVQTADAAAAVTFQVHRRDLGSREVAMRCKGDGNYLAIEKSTGLLGCTSPTPWTVWSSRVDWWDAKTASLQSPESGLYVKAVEPSLGGAVVADNDEGTGWALWRVLLTGGYESLRPMVRGVNLGNWFLLERWMANDLFFDETGKAFADECDAVDEYGLMEALDKEVARERMEKHWSSWITEDDIAWLGDHGINTVRVPFGYWMVFPSPPFVEGQLKYLDLLFRWCERHSVAVLLDFHGLKGSQTGNPTSGNCGACGNQNCGKTHVRFLEEEETNLQVIEKLSSRYADSPAYLGFAVANEVAGTASSLDTMKFYQRAYDIIRSKNKDALVVFFATFNPSTYPFQNFRSVVEDVHIYFGMGFGDPTRDQEVNLARAQKAVTGLNWNVLVGEWSLGANGHSTSTWDPADRDKFFARFAKMQLQAWESHSTGWFYWSYKTRWGNSTWNFRDMCEVGWLPGCSEELDYAPVEWWDTPSCAYAYLDGGCPAPPSTLMWWLIPLASALGAAGAVFAILKPPWLVNCVLGAAGAALAAASAAASAVTGLVTGGSGWEHLASGKADSGAAGLPDRELTGNTNHSKDAQGRAEPAVEQPFIW
uniref:glucan 1,3-beta-glucosidase n=1 Tax=Alexandrium monilatum TaxID=311494 RepID=A0A7S4RIQ4_9DINO